MGTVVVLLGLVAVVTLIIRKLVKDKKEGKGCCSGDCSNCKSCH